MKKSHVESNYSIYNTLVDNKNSYGYFPLLKFNQNLYNLCQSKFCNFLNNRKNDIRLIINNKVNQQISLEDYISSSNFNELTPIPFINKRKIKNNQEKKELKDFQRNVVLMRRLEYSNKMKQKKMKQKYHNKMPQIIYLQKIIRGYIVRKIIKEVNLIKDTLSNFIFIIIFCLRKKYYNILKSKIYKIKLLKNNKIIKNRNIANDISSLNGNDEKTIKNDFYNMDKLKQSNVKLVDEISDGINKIIQKDNTNINEKKENNSIKEYYEDNKKEQKNDNENKNESNKNKMPTNTNTINKTDKSKNNPTIINTQNKFNHSSLQSLGKHQDSSILENDYYIDFSNKGSQQKESKMSKEEDNKSKKNIKNRNPKNDILEYYLTDISSFFAIKKTKTAIIQRQFRKYLSKKGYYGKFDKRKIIIIYLLKNKLICNIRPYVLKIIISKYKQIRNIGATQEENYSNLSSDRIDTVNNIYNVAKKEIK